MPAPIELTSPRVAPSDELGDLASTLEPEPPVDQPEPGAPPPAAADVRTGVDAGEREDVDRVLRMLESENIFEPVNAEKGAWATRKEIRKSGTSLGPTLAVLWVLSLGALGGAYYGYTRWTEHRANTAVALIEASVEDAMRGDHADLVDAERNLRHARENAPDDTTGVELLLFVHSQRALEDGAFHAGYLHSAISRAERMNAGAARVAAAEAIIAASRGLNDEARQHAEAAATAGPEDPAVLYVVGRVQQRLGISTVVENLRAAHEREGSLNAATLALAEVEAATGDRAAAVAMIDAILEADPELLRAGLWKAYLTANDVEPDAGLAALGPLQARLEHGAPTDAVLAHLTLARLMHRKGDAEAANEAVHQAAQDGATEPRLLVLVATESLAAAQLSQAEALAQRAVENAPNTPEYRKLLARVLVARHRGGRALTALAPLSSEDPEVLSLSAEAALQVGSEEAMTAAAGALDGYIDAHDEAGVGIRALAIRVQVRRGNAAVALRRAKRLARRNAGDPEAGLALAEAALAARDASVALEATERLVAATPDSADAQYLHGRAQRMSGHSAEAETALRRAAELSPGFTDAEVALGYLLLDTGKFEEAETLYAALVERRFTAGATVAFIGHLGRAEALLGLGRTEEARAEYLSLSEESRQSTSARVVEARLAIAERQAADAVRILRPIAEAEGASIDIVVLFGDALFAARETEAASVVYESAVRADSTNPEALLGYAQILILGEKWEEAISIVRRAEAALETRIRAPSVHGRMYTVRGVAAMGRGDLDGARTALRQATAQAGVPPEAWFHLGESLSAANSPESRSAYERYLELAPRGFYAARARRAIR